MNDQEREEIITKLMALGGYQEDSLRIYNNGQLLNEYHYRFGLPT